MARTNKRASHTTHHTHGALDIHVRFAQQTNLDSLLHLSLPSAASSPLWNHLLPHLSRDRRIHPYNLFKDLLKQYVKHSILDRSSFYLVASSSRFDPGSPTILAACCFEWITDDDIPSSL